MDRSNFPAAAIASRRWVVHSGNQCPNADDDGPPVCDTAFCTTGCHAEAGADAWEHLLNLHNHTLANKGCNKLLLQVTWAKWLDHIRLHTYNPDKAVPKDQTWGQNQCAHLCGRHLCIAKETRGTLKLASAEGPCCVFQNLPQVSMCPLLLCPVQLVHCSPAQAKAVSPWQHWEENGSSCTSGASSCKYYP